MESTILFETSMCMSYLNGIIDYRKNFYIKYYFISLKKLINAFNIFNIVIKTFK